MYERALDEMSLFPSYIHSLITLSELLFIPFLVYTIQIAIMLHLSIILPSSTRKINIIISARKKSSLIIMIIMRLYHQCFFYYYSSFISPESLIFTLISESITQMALFLSITLISIQNIKMVTLPFKHFIGVMLLMITMDYIIKISIEVYYEVFTLLITLTPIACCLSVYLTVLFFRHPNNDLIRLLSSNIAYVELQEILNMPIDSKNMKDNKDTFGKGGKNNKEPLIPKDYSNNYLRNKQPIKSSIDYLPTIELNFKTSFYINHNQKKRKESIEMFCTNITFFFLINIKELHIMNKVRRSLSDFLQLEKNLYNEINYDNFSKYLVEKIPGLNNKLKNHLNINELSSSAESISLIKVNVERFLRDIIKEPGLITHDVLEFFNINNTQLEQFYITYRKKYFISESIKLNTYNSLTRRLSHKKDKTLSKSLYFFISEVINDSNDLKEYIMTIRVSCENSYTIIRKNISDTIMMINEANQKVKNIQLIKDLIASITLIKQKNLWSIYDKFVNETNTTREMIAFIGQLEIVLNYISEEYPQYQNNLAISEYYQPFYSSFIFQKNTNTLHQSSSKSLDSDNQCKFEALLNENLISYIEINATNFIYIAIDFKTKVFYEVTFKIFSQTNSSDSITIKKKYTYQELKNYIDIMQSSLGINNLESLSIRKKQVYEEDLNTKHKNRLNYLQNVLTKITNHRFFLRVSYWKEIIYSDKTFLAIQKKKDLCHSNHSSMNDSFYNKLLN